MTLFQIIDRFQKLALSAPNVRTASNGDVYAALNDNPQVKYGVFFITQNTHQELEDMDRYGLTFFYIDRLDDTLEDNRLQIQSIGKEVISTVIRDFCEEYDVDVPTINYTPFTQKFKDLTAGVYAQLTIDVLKGICADDFSEILSVYQTKTINITENGQYTVTPDSNYDALEKVIINVDVPCSGSSYEEGFADGYDSGYTDGYQDGLADCGSDYDQGFEDGVAEQKSKLIATAFTENGIYTREDGFNTVTVSVSQTGYTQEDLDDAYNRGYQSGYTDGLNDCSGSGDTGYTNQYLTFEILSTNNDSTGGYLYFKSSSGYTKEIQCSINGGSWFTFHPSSDAAHIPTVNVYTGDIIRFRGDNLTYNDAPETRYCYFDDLSCTYNVYGNIMSMVDSTNFATNKTLTGSYNFCTLFRDCVGMIDASNLVLPATTLTNYCYKNMFVDCVNLEKAPVLPATTLVRGCYQDMFKNCRHLKYVKCLATNISAAECTSDWLYAAYQGAGTFVKNPAMTSWPSGSSGIPSGWTIIDA